jgi:hypothetical protein
VLPINVLAEGEKMGDKEACADYLLVNKYSICSSSTECQEWSGGLDSDKSIVHSFQEPSTEFEMVGAKAFPKQRLK